jgi:hypothetical protein
MKLIAFYLPQFHSIPENDEWWGKGFTEWSNTRKAKRLFPLHYQPKEPLYDNYYDLSDKSVMRRQMKMAKAFGIGGFCFYHYWFSGKRLLEKPIENLLIDKKADLPFCLSWANEPWTRTWDGELASKVVLQEQKYGDEKDWEQHFNYLLPFFKDTRYICCEGKPIFLIYRAESIPRCKEMLAHWNELANKSGLKGIYFIKTLTGFPERKVDMGFEAEVEFEPSRTMSQYKAEYLHRSKFFIDKVKKLPLLWRLALPIADYDKFYNMLTNRKIKTNKKRFLGAFTDWDNTARKGRNPLLLFKNVSSIKFEKYLEIQFKRSMKLDNDFLFINAWNEWAEGAYLEPDKKNGYSYLKAVRRVVSRTIKDGKVR